MPFNRYMFNIFIINNNLTKWLKKSATVGKMTATWRVKAPRCHVSTAEPPYSLYRVH